MSDKVTMIAFRSHVRDDGALVRKGQEFQVTEEEAHGYASRETPLAGPLGEEEEAPRPRKRATARKRGKGK